MEPINYRICIPSYKRAKMINLKTLAFLNRLQVPIEGIDVVVETEEMKQDYLEENSNLNIIVSNTNGIREKRNFIRNYYQFETDTRYLICIDDDMDNIMDMDKPITREAFIDATQQAFRLCEEKGLTLWGVSPFHNTFFMKRNISTNLKYICGAFFGLIIDRKYEPIFTTFNHYEDFCFTCQHFLRDNGTLRMNWLALKTKYFNPKGGITEWYGGKDKRAEAQETDASKFIELYPNMARIIKKKYGCDLRLNYRYKNSS